MITFLNLKNSLLQSEFPALCLCGNDRWLKRKAISSICEVYNIPNDMFGVENLDAPTYTDIEQACCTLSLFGTKKLVVVENFSISGGKQSQIIDKLSVLVSRCDGSFCLVFVAEEPTGFDKISGITLVNCDRLDTDSIVKWIVAYGKRQGMEIDRMCARKICDYCLQDMSRIAVETQKLIDSGDVSLENIQSLVHRDTEFVVYDLSTKIAANNVVAALDLFKHLVAEGNDPRGLLALIYSNYRRAYYVKTTDESADLATMLGVKPFAINKARELAANYKPMQLKRILNFFDDADMKLKSLFMDETEVMTELIMQIVSV